LPYAGGAPFLVRNGGKSFGTTGVGRLYGFMAGKGREQDGRKMTDAALQLRPTPHVVNLLARLVSRSL